MKILIHARHADLAEDFRAIVEEKLNSMERFSVLIERVEVEILHEANPRQGKNSHRVLGLLSSLRLRSLMILQLLIPL